MGRPMAANLVKAGHEVTVWNRTPRDVEGATTAATPAEAAKEKTPYGSVSLIPRRCKPFFLVLAARLKA